MSKKIIYPDNEILKGMQHIFSESLSVYVSCYGRPYECLAPLNGSEDVNSLIDTAVTRDIRQLLVASFSDRPVENIIDADCESDYIRARGVAIRNSTGQCIAVWIFVAFCEDLMDEETAALLPKDLRLTTEAKFDASAALLEQMSTMYFSLYEKQTGLDAKVANLDDVSKDYTYEKKKTECLSKIIELLESDKEFSVIINEILNIAGSYIGVSDAGLLREHMTTGLIDMISEYTGDGIEALQPKFKDLKKEQLPFFGEKPYTISSGSALPKAFADFFSANDITAGVFLPIEINGKVSMYLCFMMMRTPRKWSMDEIHFFGTIKRVVQSILIKRITKNSLAGSYAALDAILDNNGFGICVIVPGENEFLYRNEEFTGMFSDAKDAQEFANFVGDSDIENVKEYYASGQMRWFDVHMANIKWVDGREVRMASIYEVTESRSRIKALEKATYTDYLTGLYNRQRFEQDFAMFIKDAARADESGSFLYINLDDFDNINGGSGVKIGDAILQETSKALMAICKGKGTCYRIGGDEFAVLVPYSDNEKTDHLVETIRHRFEQPWQIDHSEGILAEYEDNDFSKGKEEFYCTMSMGVVSFPADGRRVGELMQKAQIALSMAKEEGRGLATYYSGTGANVTAKRLKMEKAMKIAVEEGCEEFEVYYQPLMDASSEKRGCIGAEALVRWKSSILGFVGPDDFINVAEYLGLIVPIGAHVLEEACNKCKYWNDFGNPDFTMSINMSVIQLTQPDIVDVVRKVLKSTDVNPANIILEITESVAIHDMEMIKGILTDIKKLGVSIALDDFGTGYSSLSRLKELPLDEIKIDKSFVDGLTEDEFSGAFVETVTSLADTINVNVVVEGVEKEKQASRLDGMNVDMFQGYLFDKPLTSEEFERKYLP